MYAQLFITSDTIINKERNNIETDLLSINSNYCNYLASKIDYFLYNDEAKKIKVSNFVLPYHIRDTLRLLFHYKVEL